MTVRIPSSGRVGITTRARIRVGPTFTPVQATGGIENIITINNIIYKVHTFTSSGILTVTSAENNIASVEYLCIAGGGGGGSGRVSNAAGPLSPLIWQSGGGGGAGGVLSGILNLNVGSYDVVVGLGGSGGVYPSTSGTPGVPSNITLFPLGASLVESIGGGGGGHGGAAGLNGGSGGGGGCTNSPIFPNNATIVSQPGGSGTLNQGNRGGSGSAPSMNSQFGGGGGGAVGVGGSPRAVDGGRGVTASIISNQTVYATGGGGGGQSNGFPNTGNGGGGGAPTGNGGSGGSGIVIIRYRV